MKRSVTVLIVATLLIGLVLLGSRDKGVSVADTSIPNNEVASGVSNDVCCG